MGSKHGKKKQWDEARNGRRMMCTPKRREEMDNRRISQVTEIISLSDYPWWEDNKYIPAGVHKNV